MNRLLRVALLATLLVTVTGCYHATIDTGRTPSTRVIDERWASGWVLGLVPPKTVETAAECADGVAMVETKLGFLNQVVGILTIGIYTPMHIKVTCAAPGAASAAAPGHEIAIAEGATTDDVIQAFGIAANAAQRLAAWSTYGSNRENRRDRLLGERGIERLVAVRPIR